MKTIKFINSFLVLAFISSNSLADALRCTPISTIPFTISAPGKYCLLENISVPYEMTAPAVTILASDVQISLNGYTIEKTSPYSIIGVNQTAFEGSSVDRVAIYDGNIRGFNPAINLNSTSSSSFSNLKISKFDLKGIEVSGNNINISNNHLRNYSYRSNGHFIVAGNSTSNSNTIKIEGNYFSANSNTPASSIINLTKVSSGSITNNNFDCGSSFYRIRHITGTSSLSSYEYPKVNHNVSNCNNGDNAISIRYGQEER